MSTTIGERIRVLRKQHELSQEKLAQLINKTKSNVSGYENDKFEPSAQTIIALCNVFNVSSDFILFGKEKNIPILELNKEIEINNRDLALACKINNLDHDEKLRLEGLIDGLLLAKEIKLDNNKKLSTSTNGEEAATDETA